LRYLPKSDSERREMLEACGLESAEGLFAQVPREARLSKPLEIAAGISEYEIVDYFRARAKRTAVGMRAFSERAFTTITGRWWWIRWSRAASF